MTNNDIYVAIIIGIKNMIDTDILNVWYVINMVNTNTVNNSRVNIITTPI